jgi:hypothetical protein
MDDTNLTEAFEQVLQDDIVAALPPAIVTLIAQLRDRLEELAAEVTRLRQQAKTDSRTSSPPLNRSVTAGASDAFQADAQ